MCGGNEDEEEAEELVRKGEGTYGTMEYICVLENEDFSVREDT